MNTQAIKQFRALTGATIVVAVNLIRDLARVNSYDSIADLVHEAVELYHDIGSPADLAAYELAVSNPTDRDIQTQLAALYSNNEYCQHEEEIEILESQLKDLKAATVAAKTCSIAYVATVTNLSKISTMGNYTTINVVSRANIGLIEFEKLLLENYGHFCTWSSADIKRIEVIASNVSLVKKTKPVQKPITKNRVVCSISAKLAKAGIKNPMAIAWQIYRDTRECLNAIATKQLQHFFRVGFSIEYTLVGLGVAPSEVLPANVLKVFAQAGLDLAY